MKTKKTLTKIIKTIHKNPKDFLHCRNNKEGVCIGPQVSVRGRFHTEMPDLYNISIELTLFYNHYKDYFELDSIYLVDPLALKIHDEDVYFEPQEAILQKIDEYKEEFNQKIDKEKFYRYFIDDKNEFFCEHGCGYQGEYQDVLEHEKTCSAKKRAASKKRKTKKPKKKKSKKKKPKTKKPKKKK